MRTQKEVFCYLFLALAIVLSQASPASRWWNESEVQSYNTTRDLAGKLGNGTFWYVDGTNGNDSNDGRTPETAFRTISKALNRYGHIDGTDTVLIRSGTYYEQISISKAGGFTVGDDNNRFTIGPYGDGEVIIDGSRTDLLEWHQLSGEPDIYSADWNYSRPPNDIILDDNFKCCRDAYSFRNLSGYGKWFYNDSSGQIYVNTNGQDPADLDIIVTTDYFDNPSGVIQVSEDYVTIYGLTVRGGDAYAFSDYPGHTGIRLIKNEFKHCGKAVRLFGINNTIIKNHLFGLILYNWPRGERYGSSGGWPPAIAFRNHSIARGNYVHDNGGEGIIGNDWVVIEDNIVHGSWSVGIYMDNSENSIVRGNLVYCYDENESDIIDDAHIGSGSSHDSVLARTRADGFVIGDESDSDYCSVPAGSKNDQYYNNIVIGCRRSFSRFADGCYNKSAYSGLRNHSIHHNTFIVPEDDCVFNDCCGMEIHYANGNNHDTKIFNNIIYASNPNTKLLSGTYNLSEDHFKGLNFSHNIWYHASRQDPFFWAPVSDRWNSAYYLNFSEWIGTANGIVPGQGSMYLDPLLKNVSQRIAEASELLEGSPAIDNAIPGLTSIDYNNISRPQGSGPDIGAWEYTSSGSEYNEADLNHDNRIDKEELRAYIYKWRRGTAELVNIISVIDLWKTKG